MNGWLGWIRTHLELELEMTTRAHHFSSHLILRRAPHHPTHVPITASRDIPRVTHTCRLIRAWCLRGRLGGWLSAPGRSPWLMRRLLVDVGLGCTKGRRIASTHLSFELAAASAGDRISVCATAVSVEKESLTLVLASRLF